MIRKCGSALAIVVALAACSGDDDAPRVTRRDSARILIVESRAPAWTEAGTWTVDSAPRLSIGAAAGADEYQFHLVRGVLRLPDGRIAVGDGGSGQVRFYDSTGVFLNAIGRRGHGPGEFGQSVMRVWRGARGDIVVEDGGNRRLNVFSEAGWFIRAVQLQRLESSPAISPLGLFDDGTILAVVTNPRRDDGAATGSPVEHPQLLYLQYADNGLMLSQVRRMRGSPTYAYTHRGSLNRSRLPFRESALHAVLGNAVAFSTGLADEVEIWSQQGDHEGIFRWEGARRPRVKDVWERYFDESMKSLTLAGRDAYREFYSLDLPLPDRVPALERLLADADGNLWAKRYLLPWESRPEWDVLAPGGEWLGTVRTPAGLTVIQIGSDFVLGTHRDDLGVERVRLHTLRKPVERARTAMR